jgi:hypothetical protein
MPADDKKSYESLPIATHDMVRQSYQTAENFRLPANKDPVNFYTISQGTGDFRTVDSNQAISRKQLKLQKKYDNCVYTNPQFDYRKSKEKYNRKNKYPGVIEVVPTKLDFEGKYSSDHHYSRSPKSTIGHNTVPVNNFTQAGENFYQDKRTLGAQGLKQFKIRKFKRRSPLK